MDNRTTQGTSRASIIFLATVVFPEALPPHKPKHKMDIKQYCKTCVQSNYKMPLL